MSPAIAATSAIDRLQGWTLLPKRLEDFIDDSIPVRMIDLFVDTLGRDEPRGGANDCKSAVMPAIGSREGLRLRVRVDPRIVPSSL